MKNVLAFLFVILLVSCVKNESCNDPNSLTCETGDLDGDGISNNADPFPIDKCRPNKLSFEENFIGRWAVKVPKLSPVGSLIIVEPNGIYQDPPALFLDNGNVVKRNWSLGSDSSFTFKVVNKDNEEATKQLKYTSYNCDTIFCKYKPDVDSLIIFFIKQ